MEEISFANPIPAHIFEVKTLLGKGAKGSVWLLIDKNDKSKKYAAKIPCDNKDVKILEREINIHSRLEHQNIIGYIERYQVNPDFSLGRNIDNCPIMLLEYIEGSDLSKMISMENFLEEPLLKYLVRDLASALVYLKHKGVYHCDVKPANVMYNASQRIFKLGDFGGSILVETKRTLVSGTPYYIAPEILKKSSEEFLPYSFASEVWAFGLTIYFAHKGGVPWRSRELPTLRREVQMGVPDWFLFGSPLDLQTLIKNCLKLDPNDRIQIENVLNDSYLTIVKT
jgi:serine/threonine protein kinase